VLLSDDFSDKSLTRRVFNSAYIVARVCVHRSREQPDFHSMERWCKDLFGFAAGKMANIALLARCNCVVGAR